MNKCISFFFIFFATNCKPIATRDLSNDSMALGITSDRISGDLFPEYNRLGVVQDNQRVISASIYYLTEDNSLQPKYFENNIAVKRAFLSTISHIGRKMNNVTVKFPNGNVDDYSDSLVKNLSGSGNFSNVPPFVEITASTNQIKIKNSTSNQQVTWKIKLILTTPSPAFGNDFGSDLALKDLVIINGHILTESIDIKLKPISEMYKGKSVAVDATTPDFFVNQTYVPAMKKFLDLTKSQPENLKKRPRIFVLNSCNSELLENMVFNASSKIPEVDNNLFMISQRNRSHFGAFYLQVPQFLSQLQGEKNWASLVRSMTISRQDAIKSKVDVELVPTFRSQKIGL